MRRTAEGAGRAADSRARREPKLTMPASMVASRAAAPVFLRTSTTKPSGSWRVAAIIVAVPRMTASDRAVPRMTASERSRGRVCRTAPSAAFRYTSRPTTPFRRVSRAGSPHTRVAQDALSDRVAGGDARRTLRVRFRPYRWDVERVRLVADRSEHRNGEHAEIGRCPRKQDGDGSGIAVRTARGRSCGARQRGEAEASEHHGSSLSPLVWPRVEGNAWPFG